MINKQFLIILIILSGSIAIKAQTRLNDSNALAANGISGTSQPGLQFWIKENEYNSKITLLEKQVSMLEEMLKKTSEPKSGITDVAGITSLEQNNPDPVSEYATLSYKVPSGSKGQIFVYNQDGVVVKTASVSKNGQSVIYVKDMPIGIYTYSLVLNGKSILSKQMLVAR
ncbi:MAG: hypothetical protein V4685_19075 [Bacteroidota bacterium]